jgi:hypothetical protein
MNTYLLSYHGGRMPESEAEQAKIMDAWTAWYDQLGSHIVDGGNPIGQMTTIGSDGSMQMGGGPNPVSGYTIISADSMNEAVEMSRTCPVLAGGGSIEVGETFNVM